MKWLGLTVLATLAGALAGCQGPVVQPGEHGRYSPSLPAYAFARGGLGVDVRGADPAIIRPLVRPPSWARAYAMVPAETSRISQAYRVVLEINGRSASPCDGPAPNSGPARALEGRVDIAATLCVFDQERSATRGQVPLDGPGDRRLASLLASLMEQLMPPLEPNAHQRGTCDGQGC